MMLKHTLPLALFTLFTFCANAGTFYSDLPSFTSAIGPTTYLETFNSRPLGGDVSSLNFSGSGYSYSAAPGTFGFYNTGSISDVWLSPEMETTVVFTFTSGNVSALGGYFFPVNAITQALSSGSITLTFSDGGTTTLTNPTSSTFTGYVSDSVLTSLTVARVANAIPIKPAINDLQVGQALGGSAVPEPQSWLLVAGGLAVVASRLRRRR